MAAQSRYFTPRVIVAVFVLIVVVPFLPLLISWQWGWWQAWVYALIAVSSFVISRALAARQHPDLLAERARMFQQQDAKSWDKLLTPLVVLGGGLIPLVAGVDARFDWSADFGLTVEVVALAAILIGYGLGSYALITNRFFSGMVRIQSDRGHHVVSDGPYGWIRHPGYAGAVVTYLATPFFLDSWWALPAAIGLTVVLIIRTALEDRTLRAELAGYRSYAKQVRYRLLPGIW